MLVDMKCPNCGAPMTGDGSKFSCPHCGTVMFDVVEAKIDEDVTVIAAEEFAQKLAENKRSFIINVNNKLEEFDVDTMVANKKIKDATEYLANGEFHKVSESLQGVNSNLFAVIRLLYLAIMKARDEYELTKYTGDIAQFYYDNLLSLADEETKRTYNDIREYCLKKQSVKDEILKVEKLFEVKLYDDAEVYAKRMCRIYPQAALAWCELYKAKKFKNPKYNGKEEYKKALACPDYLGSTQKIKDDCKKRAATALNRNEIGATLIRWFLLAGIPFALVCAGIIYFIVSELKLAWVSDYSFLLIGVSYILPVSIGIATSIRSDKKRAYKDFNNPDDFFSAIFNQIR